MQKNTSIPERALHELEDRVRLILRFWPLREDDAVLRTSGNFFLLYTELYLAERGSQYDVISLQNTAALLFAPPIPTPMFLQAATRFSAHPNPSCQSSTV